MSILYVSLSLLLLPSTICDQALDTFGHRDFHYAEDFHATCSTAVRSAMVHDIDPFIVAATCEEETQCRPNLTSSIGAVGALQVTHYWVQRPIKELSQDELIHAGVRALKLLKTCRSIDWDNLTCKRLRKTNLSWNKTLCHYNGGNVCGPKSRQYSKRILRDTRRLKRAFRKKYGKS